MKLPRTTLLALCCFALASCGKQETAETQVTDSPPAPAEKTAAATEDSPATQTALLADGLKATLELAAKRAVEELSKPEAFANSETLRIRIPNSFDPVVSALKKLGQEKLVIDFENSLNEAARSSVAASPEILGGAIRGMKLQDALAIWKGGNDAATKYLESSTRDQIEERMLPIISEQTEASGASRYLKQMSDLLSKKKGGLLDQVATLAGIKIPADFDLDQYVSEKALDGLYSTLAAEEAKIRANPAERSGELLKKAFDLFSKSNP